MGSEEQGERWYGCYRGTRGDLFVGESNAHPAKMSVALCYRIFGYMEERGWIRKGDWVLDPMCGIFTAGIVGASLGYGVVGVELEKNFFDLASKNIELLVSKMPEASRRLVLIQGDARRLRELLSGKEMIGSHTRYATPSGAISSPPYAESLNTSSIIDSSKLSAVREGKRKDAGANFQGSVPRQYGKGSDAQIGNLKDPVGDIDAVVSSPPYVDGSAAKHRGSEGPASGSRSRLARSKFAGSIPYGETEGQIGAMFDDQREDRPTYLTSMLDVYRELHAVLKPGGAVCLVTKNPIKASKIRRLDEDTIRLMEAAGFTLIERKRAMLTEELGEQMTMDGGSRKITRTRMSFFKRLHVRKHPDLAVLWEDVLFFRNDA